MEYAVELYFDSATENAIMALANKIAQRGISRRFLEYKTRPHLTLACFHDVDECLGSQVLQDFAKQHVKKPAHLGSVGMFPDSRTIFLAPIMTKELYEYQKDLHEAMRLFDTSGWAWYHPDRWAPHCTLALTGEDAENAFFEASDLVLHEFQKLSGAFESVGLVKITFPVEEVYTVELA